ncbi:S1C family serine protease [Tunicatimonas pelagia]|uniref:S1C family serine protease n=1 Tax=Tunicatimonas pelagia TaxID=931531 RepID=UPI002665C4C0|nr:trypsin-like peptidase domain-containing protein [Tunicatimonas pelagia]WKN42875.1 trypsin-like peptidase domain-containing protein [Tunicatimonas pelagia]
MKYLATHFIFILATIFCTGCATILGGGSQEVTIRTNAPDAEVYIDNEHVGTGETVTAKVKKDLEAKQIRIDREGYKSEYRVHYQEKKSPLKLLSWATAGALIAAPMSAGSSLAIYGLFGLFIPIYDSGPRSFDYHRDAGEVITYDSQIASRQENQKYVFLSSTSFNIEENDLIIESYNDKQYKKGRAPKLTSRDNNKISIENTIFNDALNSVLLTYGFIDTTRKILKKKTNTLYISANVTGLKFKQISKPYSAFSGSARFLVSETSIDWTISDVYQQPKFQSSNTASSGEFALTTGYSSDSDLGVATISINDAVKSSFLKLMANPKAQALLQIEEEEIVEMEEMTIFSASRAVNSLTAARETTVTIINKDGHGSGCVIGKNGEIITNYHVVAGASDLTVRLNNGEEYPADVVRYSEFGDLALLKIRKTFNTAFKLPTKKNYSIGEEVYAIGTPTSVDLGQTLSKGIISSERTQEDQEWIQTDVSINPGNSGGALVNTKGELVGVVNSKLMGRGIEGISFCIPAKSVSELLSIKYGSGIQ